MDHDEALERIEIAALEPDGLERLAAGDTADAAAVAGHLAGCPSCAAELGRIRRTSQLVRVVIREEPDPALRERTLAFVREVGRERGGAPAAASTAPVGGTARAPAPAAGTVPVGALSPRRRPRIAVLAGIAAALVVVGILGYAAGAWTSPAATPAAGEVAVLGNATATAMRVGADPNSRSVALTPVDGSAASGTLLFSPASGELVVTATGLGAAPAGAEYACWIELNGRRRRLGEMYPAGDLHAWSGVAVGLESVPAGTPFGVSLVRAGGGQGEPVLTGVLE